MKQKQKIIYIYIIYTPTTLKYVRNGMKEQMGKRKGKSSNHTHTHTQTHAWHAEKLAHTLMLVGPLSKPIVRVRDHSPVERAPGAV